MDDFFCENVPVLPRHRGPVLPPAPWGEALAALARNADRMRPGECNRPRTRRLLLDYLRSCRTLPYASSSCFLERGVAVLARHALLLPPGSSLAEDDHAWPAAVALGLTAAVVPCRDCAAHPQDQHRFTFAAGRDVLVLDYFCRGRARVSPLGLCGGVAARYDRCRCGRWFRRLAVL